jgi:hypothetical protein
LSPFGHAVGIVPAPRPYVCFQQTPSCAANAALVCVLCSWGVSTSGPASAEQPTAPSPAMDDNIIVAEIVERNQERATGEELIACMIMGYPCTATRLGGRGLSK